ncbi:GDSL-type esterase/lipase family protein [Vibrio parahaemolyticus]|nr:GDSL-type esterase/lipase family protein [Vibrio parahaemolyticus]MDF5385361.1 GDSL-type esterase/lipase family protein [Vibrio parahaemolyticus]
MSSDFPDLVISFEEIVEALKIKLTNDPSALTTYNGELIQSIAKDIVDHFSEMNAMVQGRLQYKTKADMDAAGAPPGTELAEVWGDSVEANNGLYGWDTDAWVESPYGGLRADSVGRTQLKDVFLSKGTLVTGTDLNSINGEGTYYGAGNNGFLNLPSDFDATRGFVLFVHDAFDGSARFTIQTLTRFDSPLERWIRRHDMDNPGAASWINLRSTDSLLDNAVTNSKIADQHVSRPKLTNSYQFVRTLANGEDLNGISGDGVYFVPSSNLISNMPDEAAARVTAFGRNHVLIVNDVTAAGVGGIYHQQVLRDYNDPSWEWARLVVIGTTTGNSGWFSRRAPVNMLSRGLVSSASSLMNVVSDGVYSLAANGNYTDVPVGFDATKIYTLWVHDAWQSGSERRFLTQTIRRYDNQNLGWTRRLDTQGEEGASIWQPLIGSAGSVSRTELNDNPLGLDMVTSGDLNNAPFTKSGVWVVTSDVLNNPCKNTVILETWGASSGWIVQRASRYNDKSSTVYTRVVRPGADYSEWKSQGATPVYNMVCMGDSVTDGSDRYPTYLSHRLGNFVTNIGIGGTRLGYHDNADYHKVSGFAFAEAIASGDWTSVIEGGMAIGKTTQVNNAANMDWSTVDLLTIAYGQNDFAGEVPIGTNSDTDESTFKGAFNKAISSILTNYPQIRIFVICPTYRSRLTSGDGLNSDDNPNGLGSYLIDYVDALKELCAIHKIPYIDLYRESCINKYNAHYWLSDGLHPGSEGSVMLGNKIAGAIHATF